jgi:transposase
MGISRHTVSLWIKRYKDTNMLNRQPGSGRPNKLNNDEVEQITDYVEENPKSSLHEICLYLEEKNIYLSKASVSKYLRDNDFKYKNVVNKPFLKDEHKNDSVIFATTNKNRKWGDVMFSDETSVWIEQYKKVWVKKDDKIVAKIVKFPYKVHIWAAIYKGGRSAICLFTGIMDSYKYKDIISNYMINLYNEKKNNNHRFIFQQDNDSKHTAHIITAYFTNNKVKI